MSAPSMGEEGQGILVRRAITIGRAPEEVYRFWRNFENLPNFMEHLESVSVIDETHSHWRAKAPAGSSAEWDAEIVAEEPERLIAWRSLGSTGVPNSGEVRFTPAPAERGTEIYVRLRYQPPAGIVGAAIAKVLGQEPSGQIESDLHRLRALLEAGEVPTTDGQSHAPRSPIGTAANQTDAH